MRGKNHHPDKNRRQEKPAPRAKDKAPGKTDKPGEKSLVRHRDQVLSLFHQTMLKRRQKPKPLPPPNEDRRWKDFVLDDFQVASMDALDQGEHVLLSTYTGNGKTLVADYLVEQVLAKDKEVIYTSPIKALSNQKYRDFVRIFGEDKVGLVTGDLQINPNAPLLIMTTEIYRNILLEERVSDHLTHVIYDEFHYLADEDRGAVWEEALLMTPPQVRILGLSATVSNAEEIGEWLRTFLTGPVRVITYLHRRVPLEHHYFHQDIGLGNAKEMMEFFQQHADLDQEEMAAADLRRIQVPSGDEEDLLRCLIEEKLLPCLYFSFSRKGCEEKAENFSRVFKKPLLLPEEEQRVYEIIARWREKFGELSRSLKSTVLETTLPLGVAYHHAGLHPAVKELVETLFESRLVKILFTTETFALGVNMPVKVTCFDTVTKFDGKEFRVITPTEYYQMAGRAGRRGLDEMGISIVKADFVRFREDKFVVWEKTAIQPLVSQFKLSWNLTANLAFRPESEVRHLLDLSFKNFLIRKQRLAQEAKVQLVEKSLQGEGDFLKDCADLKTPKCSLRRRELDRERKDLLSRIRSLEQRKKKHRLPKAKERMLKAFRSKLGTIEQSLRTEERECAPEQLKKCSRHLPAYQLSLKDVEKTRAELQRLIVNEHALFADFLDKKAYLRANDYLNETELLPRGRVLARLHIEELLVTELLFEGVLDSLTPQELAAIASGFVFEQDKASYYGPPLENPFLGEVTLQIFRVQAERDIPGNFRKLMIPLIYHLAGGTAWSELTHYSSMEEGDLVALVRRTIDILRQMQGALESTHPLVKKLRDARSLLARKEIIAAL